MLLDGLTSLRARLRLRRKLARERQVIAGSDLFDAAWYRERHPDLAHWAGDPLAHYLREGAAEQRAAGPHFDTQAYLAANPDVAASGTNPLVHYIRHGAAEGRGFQPQRPSQSEREGGNKRTRAPTRFSVLLAPGAADATDATLKSLLAQKGAAFELILAGSADRPSRPLEALRAGALGRKSVRVHGVDAPVPEAFLRAAIQAVQDGFVVVLDPGDVLVPDALAALANRIEGTGCDVVYSDETHCDGSAPPGAIALKPSWSPELLTACNYFGRLTAIRSSLAREALPAAGPAAEWELNLGVAERTGAIERLPTALCRRAADPGRGEAVRRAAIPMLERYWAGRRHTAQVSARPDGTYRATWPLANRPLVSIIVPNKDRAALLRTCTDGLYARTAYDRFELIVVDNRSTEPETLALYEELTARGARIVPFDAPFNYSRACNLGASVARGEMLLFLNNDIEIAEPDWLETLVRQLAEPGVGIVGPKLLYPDGAIQHAGVALGLFTLAAHVFHRAPQEDWGPIGGPDVTRNWMAVTGACQLVRRHVFDLVAGYDEDFLISYSDIVLCVEAACLGFRTVYAPAAVLVHHEGASRGHENPTRDQIAFAKRLRALGIDADPYFHPRLDTLGFVPKLRADGSAVADVMRADIERLAGAGTTPIDIHDDGAVATAAGLPWETVAWRFDPRRCGAGAEAGARILLSFVHRRRDLRVRFPNALGDGAEGAFAHWVKSEGLPLLGLGPEHAAAIDAAFAAGPGAAARQTLVYDADLRRDAPLALTPSGRAAAARSLFAARANGYLAPHEAWWFLVEAAEDPIDALCRTWAITPEWQEAVPDGGTIFGITRLARWVSTTYAVTEDWLYAQTDPRIMGDAAQVRLAYAHHPAWRSAFPEAMTDAGAAAALLRHLATRASGLSFLARGWVSARLAGDLAHAIVRPGLNVLGHFSYPSGLRISTESLVEGLRANDVPLSLRDVPIGIATDDPNGHAFTGCEVYDTTLIHVQPEPVFDTAYADGGLLPRAGRTYRIGYWYWEFDTVPASWNRAALECDELWTATEFVAEGLRRQYRQPVRVLPPGIEIAPFAMKPRDAFGFGPDEFVFLFVFHMTSVMDRKNPFGLIDAFRAAFAPGERAKLVIKTSFGEHHPAAFARLEAAAAEADILLINRTFSRDETLSLMAACDAYVSLHRSEGLGLTMAEAMLLGRPVIATRYSGNLAFMDDGNSLLVDHRIVTLERDLPPFKAGLRWAEPSVAHAAQQMRRLFDDRAFARDLGARGRADLERRLNYRTTGAAIAARLAEIAAMP